MLSPMPWSWCRSAVFALALGMCLFQASPTLAQVGAPPIVAPGAQGSSPSDEASRFPYKIELSGLLDTSQPDKQSLAVITLGFRIYRDTRQFEVVSLEAPDFPQFSPKSVIRMTKGHKISLHLMGPKDFLSKIAQSPPGMPLKIVGMFTPRFRELEVLSVEQLGYEGKH